MISTGRPIVPSTLTADLVQTYQSLGDRFSALAGMPVPSAQEVDDIIGLLRDVLFPGLASGMRPKGAELTGFVQSRVHDAALRLRRQICGGKQFRMRSVDPESSCLECEECADRITGALLSELPSIRRALTLDAEAALAGDPAARDLAEIILCYPGHYAITVSRIAHVLWKLGAPVIPRMMTEHAHRRTGIDIHPGATIGKSFFIDHGTGVVIGETTVIGDRVRIYQGVTLGALSLPSKRVAELRGGVQRHPTLEDDVVVYAGATILGGQTVVGRGAVIGGNCWVVESVPAGSRVSVSIHTEVRPPLSLVSTPSEVAPA